MGIGVELGLELLAVGKGHDDGEGAEAGGAVNDDAAGEIPNSLIVHPAAAPNPVAEGIVDEVDPEEDEEKVGLEHDAIGEGTGHEGGGDDGEHALERCEQKQEGETSEFRMRFSFQKVAKRIMNLFPLVERRWRISG